MLEFFVRSRRGSISVMLSIILIAALSLNSSLIELAKYRSMKQLYKELGENAAFSLLAHYDRDLYENFGFLALDQGVGGEDLTRYLQMNLRGSDSGLPLNNADILADVTNVSVEGIYPLSQRNVYRAQMMEFGAYRAPLSLINNTLNIEDTLNALIEKLQDALPMLEMFEDISGMVGSYVDTIASLYEYALEADECAVACEMYRDQLESYNASLSEIDSFISSYESEDNTSESSSDGWSVETQGRVKDENYEAQLRALEDAALENAAALREKIVDLEEELVEYQEKMTKFQEDRSNIPRTGMQAILSTAKVQAGGISDETMRGNTMNIIGFLEKNSDEGLEFMEGINGCMDLFFPDPQRMIEDAKLKLEEQNVKLGRPVDQLEELEIVREADPGNSSMALLQQEINHLVVEMAVGPMEGIVELAEYIKRMIEDLAKAVELIVKGAGALVLASQYGVCDWDMDHIVSGGRKLTDTFNPHAAEDKEAVKAKLAETEKIGEMVDYPVYQLAPDTMEGMNKLEKAMSDLVEAEKNFRTACGSLKVSEGIRMLKSLGELAFSLTAFIGSIVALIGEFIKQPISELMAMIYRKLYATVYATEMFSNRVTDTGDESRLNGSSFFSEGDYADPGQCFVQADAEYIYVGGDEELDNQTVAFFSILMLRLLCNISSVLTDPKLMELLAGLVEIPVAGWIAVILIVVVKLFLEAWYDMIMMIYAKEEVEIIKMGGGYFALDGSGVEDLEKMVQGVIKNEIGIDVELDGKGNSGAGSSSGGGTETGKSGGADSGWSAGSNGSADSEGSTGSGGSADSGGSAGSDGSADSGGSSAGSDGGAGSGGSAGSNGSAGSGGSMGSDGGAGSGSSTGSDGGSGSGGSAGSDGGSGNGGSTGSDGGSNSTDGADGNSKADKNAVPGFVKDYVDSLLKWGYKDHLFLLMLLFTSSDNIYNRTATLIEKQLQQKKEKDGADYTFTLDGMYTYIRVETQAEYEPLLPIPSIPGLNDKGIPIKAVNYSGY